MKLDIASTSDDCNSVLSLVGCRVFLREVGIIWWHRCQSSESPRCRRRMFYLFR